LPFLHFTLFTARVSLDMFIRKSRNK
jgi:hypothetical protein